MSLIPKTTEGRIAFFKSRIPVWTGNETVIGLTPADVAAVNGAVEAAETVLQEQRQAQLAARAKTAELGEAVTSLMSLGANAIAKIRARASSPPPAGGPQVYQAAQIPAPAAPSPVPPPGTPTDLQVILGPTGALTLRWKCPNPPGASGTVYEIRRRALGSTAPFAFVGAAGRRSFTDPTVPSAAAAAGGVMYEITAARSTVRGIPATFNVMFGAAATGGAPTADGVATVYATPSNGTPKLAA